MGLNLTWIFPQASNTSKHTGPGADQAQLCSNNFPVSRWTWVGAGGSMFYSNITKHNFSQFIFKTLTFEKFDWISAFIDTQNFQCNEAMFEAVEQQDLDAVQILLYQYTLEELDLNTPNSEGLTPLDIAILTNNVPIARTLLHVGAKESPHCK